MVNSIFPRIKNNAIQVTWVWWDQNAGTVKWVFTNLSNETQSFILLRGAEAYNHVTEDSEIQTPYYFGDAFYPIYLHYKLTQFATSQEPLIDSETLNANVPPLGIIKIGDKYLVAFVFTLKPKESYSMLEGGFVKIGNTTVVPYNPVAVKVVPMKTTEMCVGYNELAVAEYSAQIGEYTQGYSPNPKTYTTIVWKADGPFVQVFPSPVYPGKCEANPFNGLIKEFLKAIDQIIKDAEQDFEKSIHEFSAK
jgi:hypothetical protein